MRGQCDNQRVVVYWIELIIVIIVEKRLDCLLKILLYIEKIRIIYLKYSGICQNFQTNSSVIENR